MTQSIAELLTQLGSLIGGFMVAYTMFQNYFPRQLMGPINTYTRKFIDFFYPYITITFLEFDGYERSMAYASIKRYLNAHSTSQAKQLQATVIRDSEAIVLTMANRQEVTDHFNGIKLWWASRATPPSSQTISLGPREADKRFFSLTFHRSFRQTICDDYLKHVLEQGKSITVKERRRKLYTNNKGSDGGGYYSRRSLWSEVVFDHPATFRTLAMDPDRKQEIIDDLINFSESKDYYKSVGKAWKRGYLLHGPPGTGKSTMIAAMANILEYDIYDLELTSVKDNTELRKLLIDTSAKSIIVIEDIDCSLELTGQREKNKSSKDDEDKEKKKDGEEKDPIKEKLKKMEEKKSSEVTLSGLLNFIDGLWSACGGERIIVFTTNYVEKLDPALIRRGRMDKHIELSYCGFEAFKVLAKNYLKFEEHELFDKIRQLLEETKMSPADVAENLMPKLRGEERERCLMRLVKALEDAKEEARRKAEEEEEEKKSKAALMMKISGIIIYTISCRFFSSSLCMQEQNTFFLQGTPCFQIRRPNSRYCQKIRIPRKGGGSLPPLHAFHTLAITPNLKYL